MYNQDYDLYTPQIGELYGIIEPIGVHIYIIQKLLPRDHLWGEWSEAPYRSGVEGADGSGVSRNGPNTRHLIYPLVI
jgi:hypothetical protein